MQQGYVHANDRPADEAAEAPPRPPAGFSAAPPTHATPPSESSADSWRPSAVEAPQSPAILVRAEDLAVRNTAFPAVGETFLGFRLIAELGRGAFGRVYLARQGDLADRLVALKVSAEVQAESQRLAQLQHTHIVPVYSLHQAGALQAVCMPYFGSTTLADVLYDLVNKGTPPASGRGLVSTLQERRSRTVPSASGPSALRLPPVEQVPLPAAGHSDVTLRMLAGLTYVEAVLWLVARLTDGLAHAHERGILHRDLKPANVLLTDEGQPMLLDFNLSAAVSDERARVGGTLPYMAPEHLAAFAGQQRVVDARSDLYSLGVILFELLTGRHPFRRHHSPDTEAMSRMVRERMQSPPRLRPLSPGLPRAVENIVRKCLAPDPARRYASARNLREDLERQLDSRPLRHAGDWWPSERAAKWLRRHPRLAAALPIMAVAGVLLLSLTSLLSATQRQAVEQRAQLDQTEERLEVSERRRHDEERLHAFRADLAAARLDLAAHPNDRVRLARGRDRARAALARFHVLEAAPWRLRTECTDLPKEERTQLEREAGELLLLLAVCGEENPEARAPLLAAAADAFGDHPPQALWLAQAALAEQQGRADEALRCRRCADATPPRDGLDHHLLACELAGRGRLTEAADAARQAVRLEPRFTPAWYLLGNLSLDGYAGPSFRPDEAVAAYTAALAHTPDHADLFAQRGLAHLRRGEYAQAEDDFRRALRLQPTALLHQHRARALEGLERFREALDELNQAVTLGPPTNRAYFGRARVRQRLGDSDGARADRAAGLRLDPPDEENCVARGVAWLQDGDAGQALADFRRATEHNPRSLPGWQNQAHVLAEVQGRTAEAVAVMDRIVVLQPRLAAARSARAVLHARLGHLELAHVDIRTALELGDDGEVLFQAAGAHALLRGALTRQAEALRRVGVETAARERERCASHERERGLQLLSEALRHGFGFDLLATDHDLDALRGEDRFQALLRAVRTLQGNGE
jgi:serine/threonine protein kinase/Flp pilus assembly protein TadD